jgi:hypothetical protein
MFRFCFKEYVVSEKNGRVSYFSVNKVYQQTIEVTLYQEDESNKVNYQDLELTIHETEKEQYVEVLGIKVFASSYYNPEIQTAVFI